MLPLLFIVLVGNVHFCESQFVPKIQIETTYQYHEDVIPNTLNIRCIPSMTGNCARKIVMIQLSKDVGKIVASLGGDNVVTYGHLQKTSVKADGRIDPETNNSFLSVTLSDVMEEDSGVYSCTVMYLDQHYRLEQESASDNITVQGQDLQDVVRHLMAKVSFLETVVKFNQNKTQEKLSYLETRVVDQATQLQVQEQQTNQLVEKNWSTQAKLSYLETRVADQATQLQVQEQQTNQLVEKSLLNYVFLAGYENKSPLTVGDVLQFTNVKLNVGDAFDKASGVFTAPVDGLYYFHLFMLSSGGNSNVQASISVNNEKLAILHPWDSNHLGQASASCNVILKAGQTVKCVVHYLNGVDKRLHAFPFTGFLGHLVKAL